MVRRTGLNPCPTACGLPVTCHLISLGTSINFCMEVLGIALSVLYLL